ncbi:hypothetical protein HD553DRAFT_354913 [Filobasidium floriforme]|uniref:uncharacterized protein n=1 Tax=Filobasidium floriforme TaxID=5210 RepID=UPI001E8D5079|nr:uncharacterized protein HD553DRAFT_354913 [Filobasidium floriforme]KAH8090973.1 hypothetical protein HD553DRAFT_354913 [Filobasidium floriforme]
MSSTSASASASASNNGRHNIRLVKKQVKAQPEDWARDTSNPAESTDAAITSQWNQLLETKPSKAAPQWRQRYPNPPISVSSPLTPLPESSPQTDIIEGSADPPTDPEHLQEGNVANMTSEQIRNKLVNNVAVSDKRQSDSQMSSRSKVLKEHLLPVVHHQLDGQFDPTFVKLEVHPDQAKEGNALLERGRVAYRSKEALDLRRQIANFNKKPAEETEDKPSQKKSVEKAGSKAEAKSKDGEGSKANNKDSSSAKTTEREIRLAQLQTRLLNLVSRAMVGKSYSDLHHENGDKHVDYSTMALGNKFPQIRADILTLKESRADLVTARLTANNICAAGATKIERNEDKLRGNSDDLACYSLTCVRDTPIAGTVYGFTACGPLFRLWCYDPLCYSSGLPCDVSPDNDDQDHIDDFLKMVALLCGPLDVLICHWKPRDQAFLAFRDDPDDLESEPLQITNWKSLVSNRPHGAVFVREQLIGRRSTAFAGKGTINGKEKDLVIKLSYLSKDLCRHEQRVTRHIRDFKFDELLDSGVVRGFELDENDVSNLRRGYSRLPRYVGTLDFGDYAAKQIDHVDAETGLTGTLYLSGLVTEGLHGTILSAKAPEDQTMQVYGDAARCLWASALCDVYYRDPNQGNILLHAEGGGMLIDFGNAVIRSLTDSAITLYQRSSRLEDDARSANPYFISLVSDEAGFKAQVYTEALTAWEKIKHKSEGDPDRLKAEKKLRDAERQIDEFRAPRFFDDLESIIYCLLHQLGRHQEKFSTKGEVIAANPAEASLISDGPKRKMWTQHYLHPVMDNLKLQSGNEDAIIASADHIKSAGVVFLDTYPIEVSEQSGQSRRSDPELSTPTDNTCFREVIKEFPAVESYSPNTLPTTTSDAGAPKRPISAVTDSYQPPATRPRK